MRGAACLCLLLVACARATTGGQMQPDAQRIVDGAAPPIDAPATMSCTSSATCQGAKALGSISGDTGSGMVSANGFQSAWLRVRVTEDDSSVIGNDLSVTATLTLPAGEQFDVLLYVNSGSDVVECTTSSGTATKTGNTEQLRITWGEGSVANGSDDSRDVSVEIRPTSTACSPSSMWQLVVQGNT
ncbi:MAG: hypothetical protein ACM31C_10530 [Acidobacteriota bacterium]